MYEVISAAFWSGVLTGVILLGIILALLFNNSKTKKYRRDVTNLYVAGKIRQIATEDKINISEEYERFKKFIKKRNMEEWDLDTTIEEELKEKIVEKKKEVKEK
jgi:hypothetical protein